MYQNISDTRTIFTTFTQTDFYVSSHNVSHMQHFLFTVLSILSISLRINKVLNVNNGYNITPHKVYQNKRHKQRRICLYIKKM